MAARPRIALVHATPVAIEPIQAAFASGWPEAELANILDDSLAADRARSPELSPALIDRFRTLARYARNAGADAVLFTCSAFGPAIEQAAQDLSIPVLKPNEAMFEAALAAGRNLGMVVTFEPAAVPMQAEFEDATAGLEPRPTLSTVVVPEAMQALRSGDGAGHDRLVAERGSALRACDAIMLGQFSTARAAAALRGAVHMPILTSPDAAVAKVRRLVQGR